MNRMFKAYKLNDSDTVVTKKSLIHNAKDTDFTEVSLIISNNEIQQWADENKLMMKEEEES